MGEFKFNIAYWIMWAGMWTFLSFTKDINLLDMLICVNIFFIPILFLDLMEYTKGEKRR